MYRRYAEVSKRDEGTAGCRYVHKHILSLGDQNYSLLGVQESVPRLSLARQIEHLLAERLTKPPLQDLGPRCVPFTECHVCTNRVITNVAVQAWRSELPNRNHTKTNSK